MELQPGARLGPYEILSLIGRGGMGQVWKARDTRLGRPVAIKTALGKFSERFETEARAVAALNHPHICTLYDIGPDYLVMEYVEGAKLRGPLPIGQVLKYGAQLAGALAAAHSRGITHRDLKPANILVAKSGVKVLDFGLAKIEPANPPPNETTTTLELTQAGTILGTLRYMAPERLQGGSVDARADIFSLGCVLYEMLTDKRAFDGATGANVIAAILGNPAPSVQDLAPESLDWLLQRCLKKDPDERWQSALDVMAMLERIGESTARRPSHRWVTAGVLAAVVAAASLLYLYVRGMSVREPTLYSSISIPENTSPGFLALSPDGSRLVLSLFSQGNFQLYLRSIDSPRLTPVSNTFTARTPFWSPDGRYIGFFADGELKTMPVEGGPAQVLCNAGQGWGGTWGRNGTILFGTERPGPILRVNPAGGPCTPITRAEPASAHGLPEFLPDGNHFFYTVDDADISKRGVYIASLDKPGGRRVLADLSGVIYTPPSPPNRYGQLLFVRERRLMAQSFDDRGLQTQGEALTVAEPVGFSATSAQPAASASANGLLAYIGNLTWDVQLAWIDRNGKEIAKAGLRNDEFGVALSPDHKTVAMTGEGLWLRSLVRDSESRLAETGSAPVWSPDGKRIIYSKGNDLFLKESAGGGAEVPVMANANPKRASDWSRDGRFLLYTEVDPKTRGDLWYLADPSAGSGRAKALPYLNTPAMESEAQFSPDGRWVAYVSDESGKLQVYIRPFPSGPGEWKVSTSLGLEPRWSATGKEIYYIEPGFLSKVMVTTVRSDREGTIEVGVPKALFEFRNVLNVPEDNDFAYSPAINGGFLVNVSADTGAPTINLISHWQKLIGGVIGHSMISDGARSAATR